MPFIRLPRGQQTRLFCRQAKQEADGQKTKSVRCTAPVRRTANHLACFAARPNRRQTAEKLHQYDAPLPSAVPPTSSPVLPQGQTGGRRPKNYICTMPSTGCRNRQPPSLFSRRRNRRQTAKKLNLHDAFYRLPHVCRVAQPSRLFCRRRNRRQTAKKLHLHDAFYRLPHACRAANHLACFADRRNRRQTAEQLHLYDTFYRLTCHQPASLFCREAKQEADGRKITSARCTAPVCRASPTISPVLPQAKQEADGKKITSARCTAPVCRIINRLACFAARRNRRQTAEKLHLHDAFCRLPLRQPARLFSRRRNRRQTAKKLHLYDAFYRLPHHQPASLFCRRRNWKQTAEQLHLHDTPLPSAAHHQPSRLFCRQAKQEADGRKATSARCLLPSAPRLPRRQPSSLFCRKAKQEADGQKTTSARYPSPVCPRRKPSRLFSRKAKQEADGRAITSVRCLPPSAPAHAANQLASFADRPNRKQTAEKLHLYDAFSRLPHPPASSPV